MIAGAAVALGCLQRRIRLVAPVKYVGDVAAGLGPDVVVVDHSGFVLLLFVDGAVLLSLC